MTTFSVEELRPQPAAVVRGEVPMSELTSFFDRAFGAVMQAMTDQGLTPTDAPFAFYPRMPTGTVEICAGFPVSGPVRAGDGIEAFELPGGRAVVGMHVGSYDDLSSTYEQLLTWAREQGVELAEGMWETYLSDPGAEPDPSQWRTRVTWPVR